MEESSILITYHPGSAVFLSLITQVPGLANFF